MLRALSILSAVNLFIVAGVNAEAEASTKLVFFASPDASVATGVPFSRQPVVQMVDELGNSIFDNSCVVSLSLVGGDPADTLLGRSLTKTMSGGVADFSGLDIRVQRVSNSPKLIAFRLVATPSGPCEALRQVGPAESELFVVTMAGVPDHLAFVQAPGAAFLNQEWAQQPIIEVLDVEGNLVSNDNSTVVAISKVDGSPSGVLVGSTAISVVNGIGTFSGLQVSSTENDATGLYQYRFQGFYPGLRIEELLGATQVVGKWER